MRIDLLLATMTIFFQRGSSLLSRRITAATTAARGQGHRRSLAVSRRQTEEERIVYEQLVGACRVRDSSQLLLCVSGGVDSVALLHLLAAVKHSRMPSLSLSVINFNHKLRSESDEEAQFVSRLASEYGLPYFQREMPQEMRERIAASGGVQNSAREWRRSETLEITRQWDFASQGSGIVTAHHSDDQVETTLLKLMRGAHISKLYPILPRSECGRFVRPLLTLSKEQLVGYMKTRNLEWREDSSNQERNYRRNDVRLGLIPAMEEIAGGGESLKRRILALGQQSIELHEWLRREALDFLDAQEDMVKDNDKDKDNERGRKNSRINILVDGEKSRFARLPSMVQSEVLHLLCSRLTSSTTDYAQVQRVFALAREDVSSNGAKSKSLRLSEDWIVTKIGTVLRFEQKAREQAAPLIVRKIVHGSISLEYDSSVLSVDADMQSGGEEDEGELHMSLAPDANVSVRLPRPGDSFQPPWKSSPVKLVDFLRGAGIPVEDRDQVILVLVDQRIAAVVRGSQITYSVPPLVGSVALTLRLSLL